MNSLSYKPVWGISLSFYVHLQNIPFANAQPAAAAAAATQPDVNDGIPSEKRARLEEK